jgi:hypothetical protein
VYEPSKRPDRARPGGRAPSASDEKRARELNAEKEPTASHDAAVDVAAPYFVVSAALTNVAKHAKVDEGDRHGTSRRRPLTIQAQGDGAGGAQILAGSGLASLRDRIRALDGDLQLGGQPGCTGVAFRPPSRLARLHEELVDGIRHGGERAQPPHGTCIGVPRIGWGYSTVRSIVNEPANSPLPKSNPSTTV